MALKFSLIEIQMLDLAIKGAEFANSDASEKEWHARQENTYGAFADAIERITVHRFNRWVYDHAIGSQDFSGARHWESVCVDLFEEWQDEMKYAERHGL